MKVLMSNILAIMLIMSASSVGADDTNQNSYPLGEYGKMMESIDKLRILAAKSIGDTGLFQGGWIGSLYYGQNQSWNESGNTTTNTSGTEYTRKLKHQMKMIPSVDLFAATMKSQDYSNMTFDLTNSRASVQEISIGLAEPGILNGRGVAVNAGLGFVMSRLLAQQALADQFANFPEWGQGAARAYFACLMKEASGGQGSQDERLLRAHAQCSGDEFSPTNTGMNTQQQGQRIFTGKFFDMLDDPIIEGKEGVTEDNVEVRLTDLLFGNDQDIAGAGLDRPNPTGTQANYTQLKRSFQEFIGDYKIVGKKTMNSNDGKGIKFEYERIAPTTPPTQVFNDLTTRTYNNELKALQQYCEKFKRADDVEAALQWRNDMFSQSNCEVKPGGGDSFCSLVRMNSVPGFEQTLYMVDFMVEELLKLTTDKGSGACNKVFQERLALSNLQGKPEEVTNQAVALFRLAEGIAAQKMMITFKKVEEITMKLSAGSFPSQFRDLALNIVYEAARSRNIQDQYDQGLAHMNRLVVNLPNIMQKQSRGGTAVTSTFKGRTNRGLPENANPAS